jgi:hypothetical protein
MNDYLQQSCTMQLSYFVLLGFFTAVSSIEFTTPPSVGSIRDYSLNALYPEESILVFQWTLDTSGDDKLISITPNQDGPGDIFEYVLCTLALSPFLSTHSITFGSRDSQRCGSVVSLGKRDPAVPA